MFSKTKRSIVIKLLLAICAMLGLAGGLAAPAAAQEAGWWNTDWGFRKAIEVDTSASGINVSGPVGRTVVLVRLHSGNFDFAEALENGADIRFVDNDNATPLPFHVEQYDPTTGLAAVWVSVPNLNGGEKHRIWLYFGNSSAPAGADEPATFDPDHGAVYHFSGDAGQPASDSTANANATQNPVAAVDDSGIIGRAASFAGQGGLQIAPSGSLAMAAGAPFTFSVWVKPAQLAGQQALLQRGALTIGLNAGVPYAQVGNQLVAGRTAVTASDWTHVAVTADDTTVRVYVNGIEDGAAALTLPALDGAITLGGSFAGSLDEARISKTARPANMLLAMVQAEGPGGKLLVIDEGAEEPSEGSGVLGFIISKVEPIDIGIIALCMVLLALAAAVMISKGRYIANAAKANAAFIQRYRAMEENPVLLKDVSGIEEGEYRLLTSSPLARIYETGMEEWEMRKRRAGASALSSEAVEAMRASANSIFIEENQKLDKWMVILTIAISGGPFIGLLGTVMGVMNTFGGVAMAGDVNVNAIAPGIAAALLATVAGLACAIPALFGYNYLNSRISPIADEMRVFIEQLIARIAEIQHDQSMGRSPAAAR